MLYIFSGKDFKKRQEKLNSFLQKHKNNVLSFDEIGFSIENFVSLLRNQDIFGDSPIYLFEDVLSGFKNEIFSFLKEINDSEKIFIFNEQEIDKILIEKINKISKNVYLFDSADGKKEKFNIFSITDSFGERDKKKTWILLQKAIQNNVSSEEIVNILIWQVKNLLITKESGDIKKTGLSPFVFKKSKKYSENFKLEELADYSRKLVSFFHENHLGLDINQNLELFILKNL